MISYYCIFVKLQTINSCWFIFQAGAIAEEVLASIRTVVAFGGQKKEVPFCICVQNVLMMLQLTFLSKIVGEILLRAKRCKEELHCQRYIEHSPHLKVEYNVFFCIRDYWPIFNGSNVWTDLLCLWSWLLVRE